MAVDIPHDCTLAGSRLQHGRVLVMVGDCRAGGTDRPRRLAGYDIRCEFRVRCAGRLARTPSAYYNESCLNNTSLGWGGL